MIRFITTSEKGIISWRRAEMTDLPKLKELATIEASQFFGSFDIKRVITENPLSLCQVDSNGKITVFISFSDHPTIRCVAFGRWTEWFKYFYERPDVNENNTLFIHVLLYRCIENLAYLISLFEIACLQIPEINYIILIKRPEIKLCEHICSMFTTLSAKNVINHPEFGCPEVLYYTSATTIQKVNLRNAQINDFISLRATLGARLDFLDKFYGEYSLAKILEFPGDGRFNFIPTSPIKDVNGLVIINTDLDYSSLDSVFDLHQFEGLIEYHKKKEKGLKSILRIPGGTHHTMEMAVTIKEENHYKMGLKQDHDKFENMNRSFQGSILQNDDTISLDSCPTETTTNNEDINFKDFCDYKLINIVKDFLKFQDHTKNTNMIDSMYSVGLKDHPTSSKISFQKTGFMIELMLINDDEENDVSWAYFVAFFHKFPQFDFCLVNIHTIETAAKFKKFFCKVSLKPNCKYSLGLLYVLHRSSVFGNLNCVMVTKEHLEIMDNLIENHTFKHVVSNNISKSVFEDTRYKTYIFQCDDYPIGYCVIQLNDEIDFLSSHFDVAKYTYPELARNHMAILLNMDFQRIFLKRIRCFLKQVMEDSNLNCLFYKVYSSSMLMEKHEMSYTNGISELIPIKPRIRIQYDNKDKFDAYEKFSLFHMNTRLCTTQKISIDAKIVVVGASNVALSFIENLVFNPVNYCTSFENIVLISNCGMPYRVRLSDLEDCMIPKVAHYNYDYMKSIGLYTFVNVISGTVTAINRSEKYVKIDGANILDYDYLFLFNGEQFTYKQEENESKCYKPRTVHRSNKDNIMAENLFLLNSDSEINYAFNCIQTMKNSKKDIIVYGKYLGALSVINVLLEKNVDGSRIVYAESDYKENTRFIASQFIAKAVYNELYKKGVRIFRKCKFEKLKLNKNQSKVQEVKFRSNAERITLKCAGLFWFEQKLISKVNWLTMIGIGSSMHFDGHLVVNTSFETNIEYIYAAGPIAKFNHDNFLIASYHLNYNSIEIGARVASMVTVELLNIIDDGQIDAEYVRPLWIYCQLPGKYNYLHSVVPGFTKTSLTSIFKTGNATTGYFEIVTNDNGDLLELSCYTKRDFKYKNLIHLCGKNVHLFNDIIGRLRTNSIPCLFDYFEKPWAYPLYSDRFWKLVDDMNYTLKKDIKKFLIDDIATLVSKHNTKLISVLSKRAGLDGRFDRIYGEKLRDILLNFIDDNLDDFPALSHVRVTLDRMNSIKFEEIR